MAKKKKRKTKTPGWGAERAFTKAGKKAMRRAGKKQRAHVRKVTGKKVPVPSSVIEARAAALLKPKNARALKIYRSVIG